MFSCFDHSRCSLTSGFPVYLYEPDKFMILHKEWDVDGFLKTTLKHALGYNPHLTNDPKEACVHLVLVGEAFKSIENFDTNVTNKISSIDSSALRKLKYWGGDGRNNIFLNLSRRGLTVVSEDIFSSVHTGRSIIVQSTFTHENYRPNFDLIITPVLGSPGGDVWQECSSMLPARRRYLLIFQGEIKSRTEEKFKLSELENYFHNT
ncbi:hypothetical protein WA026_002871 [Henosepilachna vigintioctopunctata]|uniref:Exostosin GT47 domain-containing protein n=1 Tax=Henosepilachna vigintioctopunctata TaxID=420089 RepID=A0AAW1TKX5_9CUCU